MSVLRNTLCVVPVFTVALLALVCGEWYSNLKLIFMFLILNFRRVLIVVSFLLGKSPASVYYCMPTFRNSLSVPSSKAMVEPLP